MRLAKQSQFIPLQNVVYFITLPVSVCKIFTFYINDVLLFKCPVPGPKGQFISMTYPLHVWNRAPIHHQQVVTVYAAYGIYRGAEKSLARPD